MTLDESGTPERKNTSACRLFDEQLAAYLEGSEQTTVPSHARECAACDGILNDLHRIRAASRELPLETPSPRIWKSLRAALAEEGLIARPRREWLGWLRTPGAALRYASATATVAALLAGALFLAGHRLSRKPGALTSGSAMGASASAPEFTAEQLALAQTVQGMEQTFKQRKTGLPPLIKLTYEKGLASLDTSIQQSMDSVRRDPRDGLARQFLMDAYAQKANVLTSALEYGGQ